MSPAAASAPTHTGHFQSTSKRTVLEYFRCVFPVGTPSSFRGPVSVPAGFDQAEVLLCGFTLTAETHEAPVGRVAVNVQKFRYDSSTGMLEVGVTTQFATDGQGAAGEVTFVVVLTDQAAARFSRVSTSNGGTAECHIIGKSGNAVPAGMDYVGIAAQQWDVGVRAGPPIPVNGIGGDVTGLAVSPPSVWFDYLGVLRNGPWTTGMFCEWAGLIVAFDPAELSRLPTNLPYQYTFLGQHQTARLTINGANQVPAGTGFTGFLDAFQGCALLMSQSINGPESPVWVVEASATTPILGPNGMQTEYGVFLGAQFGNTASTNPDFGFQISRAVGVLH